MTDKALPALPPPRPPPMTCPVREGNWFAGGCLRGDGSEGGGRSEGNGGNRPLGRLGGCGGLRVQCHGPLCPPKSPRWQGADSAGFSPPSPAPRPVPFSFEAGGKGGWW